MAKKKNIATEPDLFAAGTATTTPILDYYPTPLDVVEKMQPPDPPPPPIEKQKKAEPPTSVKLREGQILSIGDEVTIDAGILTGLLKETHKEGEVFVIEIMTPWLYCESQMLVIAARKDDPEKKTNGVAGKGIDANWFKKI